MTELTRRVMRRRRLVLALALLATLVALPLAGKQEERLTADDVISSNSQSAAVSDAIENDVFPRAEVSPLAVVLKPAEGASPAEVRTAVGEVRERVAEVKGAEAQRAVPAGSEGALVVPVRYGEDTAIDTARELTDALKIENPDPGEAAGGKVDVHLIGQGALWAGFIERADKDTQEAEGRGLPIIVLVLLVAFGSLAAAVLPLALGAIAVIVASAIIYLLSFATEMSIFAATTASMVGLGVAIDYSLFILVRYREEIRRGASPDEARERAMATSGRAVVFSGLTVVISLCALFLISSPGVRSIAAGTIIVVAVSVLVASTVLPVLIALLGRRAHEPGRVGRLLARRRERRGRVPGAFWRRWTGVVMRRPLACLIVAVVALLALAAPTLDMSVRNSASSQLPADHQVREGIATVTEQQGPGALAPVLVMVSAESGDLPRAAAQRVRETLGRDPAIAKVGTPRASSAGDRALISAELKMASDAPAARDAVDRLRDDLPGAAEGASIDVGGTTAIVLDFDRLVSEELWRLILFVLAASFVVLLVVLRSLVLPLKATLMNVLSVLAAYGALVGVFQYGWLEWIGIDKATTIYPITLPLVLAIAFGLSMDYHIFLLSRIKERYDATGDNREAVAEALASSATPITSAALIMVAVFLAFVSAGAPSIQQLGFATAVAIAIDATIVRLVIVPAAMELLGDWNWWLPKPLERVLRGRATVSH